MANTLILNQNFESVGIETKTFTIPTTGLYTVRVEYTVVPPSSLVVLVKNGASTVFTAPTLTPTQSELRFSVTLLCTAADVITVVPSSAAAVDNLLNSVKSIVSIANGIN